MNEIKCPHCGEVFKVDESSYAAILEQVKSQEFEKEVCKRVEDAKRLSATETERRIADLKHEIESLKTAKKYVEDSAAQAQQLAVAKAVAEVTEKLAQKEKELESAAGQYELSIQKKAAEMNSRISELQQEIKTKELEKELAVKTEVQKVETEKEKQKAKYEAELKSTQELVDYYRDMKAKMSTKMVGETLEQHCRIEFERLRQTAFRRAYFDKDNDASDGTKGDFIYRDYDEDGMEFISVMFEMKNEMDETAAKHKNEDFFKKLDSDRTKKGCEYAVLVSLLEADSELYNNGIVDVSHKYPKMYVIRPQFFIPLITLLRNAAEHTLSAKKELAVIREQNIDITHFEDDLLRFQSEFSTNYVNASKRFEDAIKDIDKTIKQLEKVKEDLRLSQKHLSWANDKAGDLSIKKLTRKNPTMKAKFDALKDASDQT